LLGKCDVEFWLPGAWGGILWRRFRMRHFEMRRVKTRLYWQQRCTPVRLYRAYGGNWVVLRVG
jgi:hypothetical protein